MTDKEIIKALECCKMPVGSGSCNDCPFDYQREKRLTSTDESCTTLMFDYALDLITRQQAEIERLKHEREVLIEDIHHSADQINEQTEEIERLTTLAKLGNMRADDYRAMRDKCKTARAEAIKEFAEWVLSLFPEDKNFTTISRFTINQKLKKMVGEDK